MATSANNPAGRLHQILSATKSSSGNEPVLKVWAKALEAPSEDPADVLPLYLEAAKLPDEIEAAFERAGVEDHKEAFTKRIAAARGVFDYHHLTQQWSQVEKKIRSELLLPLEYAARELEQRSPEGPIKQADLEAFEKRISELRIEMTGEAVDPGLREFAHRQLHRLEHGIALYRIKGAEGLKEATYMVIGEFAAKSAEIDSEPEKFAFSKKAWKLVEDINLTADTALKVKELAAGAAPTAAAIALKIFGE